MEDNELDASLVTSDGMCRLLSFLPLLSARDATHGDGPSIEDAGENTISIHSAALSETASSFVQACYDEHFVQPFDWNEWSDRHQAELNDDAFIARSDIARIVKLLTTHIRADRFCDGHLLSVLEDGTIVRILERLKEINSEQNAAHVFLKPRAVSENGER